MEINCYRCKYSVRINESNISCEHPKILEEKENTTNMVLAALMSTGKLNMNFLFMDKLGVKMIEQCKVHAWPYNFDPLYLESCDGFRK